MLEDEIGGRKAVGTELPDIFRRMSLLAIPIELVVVEYEKYKAGNNS